MDILPEKRTLFIRFGGCLHPEAAGSAEGLQHFLLPHNK